MLQDRATPTMTGLGAHETAPLTEASMGGMGATAQQRAAIQAAGSLALANLLGGHGATHGAVGHGAAHGPAHPHHAPAPAVRPHAEYAGILNGHSDAVTRFRAALPIVVVFINQMLARAHIPITVTAAELATNFMAEGGDVLLARNVTSNIDGYTDVGVDTFMDRFNALLPFMPAGLAAFARQPANQRTDHNEHGTAIHTVTNMSLEQSMEANATMYADALRQLTEDLRGLSPPVDVATLDAQARMFWVTLYFNTGYGGAHRLLRHHGVNWYQTEWAGRRPHSGQSPQYNALSRASSLPVVDGALPG